MVAEIQLFEYTNKKAFWTVVKKENFFMAQQPLVGQGHLII
jgi:hypothetical protein